MLRVLLAVWLLSPVAFAGVLAAGWVARRRAARAATLRLEALAGLEALWRLPAVEPARTGL